MENINLRIDLEKRACETFISFVMRECGAVKFGDFNLANSKSRYYVDVKKVVTKPRVLDLICDHMVDVIDAMYMDINCIACVELGAVPIATVLSIKTKLDLIIIRKSQKDYGTKDRIIGDLKKGNIALLVEDVTTTGMTVISGIRCLRNEGVIVKNAISIVDRHEGAREAINKEGVELYSMIGAKKLLEDYALDKSK